MAEKQLARAYETLMNAPADTNHDTEAKKRDRIHACTTLADTITAMAAKYDRVQYMRS